MPNPTAGDVHVNRPLTNLSIAFIQEAGGFVADRVFPNVPVSNQSDVYFKYDRSDFWRASFQKRAPSTESAGGGWKQTTSSYFAHIWALHKDIADPIRANQDNPINLDRDAAIWLAQQAIITREVTWAASYFTTSLWTGLTGSAADVTGVAVSPSTNEVLQWNDANSNPIEDIRARATLQQKLTGMRPNKFVMGREVWDKLADHPDFIDRIKYSSTNNNPAIVSRNAVAALFEVEEVLVADGIQVTSAENPTFETSMTTSFIAGKKALLVYTPARPSILAPAAGLTFSWNGYLGAGDNGVRTKKFRMEPIASDRVESEMAYDQKLVASDMGTFFNSIVA